MFFSVVKIYRLIYSKLLYIFLLLHENVGGRQKERSFKNENFIRTISNSEWWNIILLLFHLQFQNFWD